MLVAMLYYVKTMVCDVAIKSLEITLIYNRPVMALKSVRTMHKKMAISFSLNSGNFNRRVYVILFYLFNYLYDQL